MIFSSAPNEILIFAPSSVPIHRPQNHMHAAFQNVLSPDPKGSKYDIDTPTLAKHRKHPQRPAGLPTGLICTSNKVSPDGVDHFFNTVWTVFFFFLSLGVDSHSSGRSLHRHRSRTDIGAYSAVDKCHTHTYRTHRTVIMSRGFCY